MKKYSYSAAALFLACLPSLSFAGVYSVQPNVQVVGNVKTITASYADSLKDLSRNYNIGLENLKAANPGKNMYVPGDGAKITIPSQHIVPDNCKGIYINQAERRLYYCPTDGSRVATYPISIGDEQTPTPRGKASVTAKMTNPTWHVPNSIYKEHIAKGKPISRIIPPGPDNPLGKYALKLSMSGYEIHGTNAPDGIGVRISHGCIRLYPEDIKSLYSMVTVGTPVMITHEPYKAGWSNGELYFEAHKPFRDFVGQGHNDMALARKVISKKINGRDVNVNWQLVEQMVNNPTGVPKVISTKGPVSNGQVIYSQNELPTTPSIQRR